MKIINKVAACAMAAAIAAGYAAPVMAAGTTYTAIPGGSVNVEKYLVMDKDANVPNVTFEYAIASGTAQNASGTNARVFAGPTGAEIGTATFTQGQETFTTAQAIPAGTGQKAAEATDPVELESTEKYARSPIQVNLANVRFNEPGIYRYIITESASSAAGITMDDDASRVLDVYVVDNGSGLEVEGYVLHKSAADAVVPKEYAAGNPSTKTEGYVNEYTSHDLTLSKQVTGNQASRDEYFEFTVTISDAVAGTVYDVDLTNADATTKTNGINTETHTNPASLTVGSGGTVTQTFWLQNGQSIKIKGLANNTGYSINENKTTLDNEGYTATATITEGAGASQDGEYTSSTTVAADADITADSTVAYTNAKSGVIPTGIVMSVLPGAAVVLLGAAGATIAMKRRKEDEE